MVGALVVVFGVSFAGGEFAGSTFLTLLLFYFAGELIWTALAVRAYNARQMNR
jgi:hypothetical protein